MADPFPHDLLRRIHLEKETPRQVKRWIRAALPPVTVDYEGCAMHVHPNDNNTEFQIWRMGRTHEEHALRDILNLLGSAPIMHLMWEQMPAPLPFGWAQMHQKARSSMHLNRTHKCAHDWNIIYL